MKKRAAEGVSLRHTAVLTPGYREAEWLSNERENNQIEHTHADDTRTHILKITHLPSCTQIRELFPYNTHNTTHIQLVMSAGTKENKSESLPALIQFQLN